MTTQTLTDIMADMGLGFGALFDAMDVAEREIERAMKRHPEHKLKLWNSFGLLLPHYGIERKHPKMYEHHCRELLARVVEGADTRPGTTAECLLASSTAASMIPLKAFGLTMHARMFAAVFGESELERLTGRKLAEMYEEYPTQVDELIAGLRKETRVDDRVPKKPDEYMRPLWWDDEADAAPAPIATTTQQLALPGLDEVAA